MLAHASSALLLRLKDRLYQEGAIRSAVLFGSHARVQADLAAADEFSDIDLHLVVASAPAELRRIIARLVSNEKPILISDRPSEGGARKFSVLLPNTTVEFVTLAERSARIANLLLILNATRRIPIAHRALNKLSTILSGGYIFIKGEKASRGFYRRVAKLPGVRLSDDDIVRLAQVCILEIVSTFRKIQRGELIAAQRLLHTTVREHNLELLHELRLRRDKASFQQARRAETLLSEEERSAVQLECHLSQNGLAAATVKMHAGLYWILSQLNVSFQQAGQCGQVINALKESVMKSSTPKATDALRSTPEELSQD